MASIGVDELTLIIESSIILIELVGSEYLLGLILPSAVNN
jgi:hypothetical protein